MNKYSNGRCLALILILFMYISAFSQSEKDYARVIQLEIGGQLEKVLPDGSRVDLITDDYAYEIDRAFKWKESIGQALWYALQSNKKPAIIIIRETKADFKYIQQLMSSLNHTGLSKEIIVKVFPDDFTIQSTVFSNRVNKPTGYWLSRNSKKRHNRSCHNYEITNGYYCSANEGKPAGCCGG